MPLLLLSALVNSAYADTTNARSIPLDGQSNFRDLGAYDTEDGRRIKPGLLVTGALTLAFLAGQFAAWRMLAASGQYAWSNPANAFFYLMTVAHALHILGGMYVWARATLRVVKGAHPDSVRESVVLCTVYWHFLLIVWLVMFGLMLST